VFIKACAAFTSGEDALQLDDRVKFGSSPKYFSCKYLNQKKNEKKTKITKAHVI